jgi:pyridoxamine 5'-phosphate oxidase
VSAPGTAPWLAQFGAWHAQARAAPLAEPDAMVLATVGADGQPSARSVLLKRVDERGFVFFTNLRSRKGTEIAAEPRVSLVFPWYQLRRQVVVIGAAAPVGSDESDEYFATRAYGSRISARASNQSQVVGSREELERAHAAEAARYPPEGEVPRPAHWGGFLVTPASVEFWSGRRDRLHDRLRHRREGDDWVLERLSP